MREFVNVIIALAVWLDGCKMSDACMQNRENFSSRVVLPLKL